MIDRSVPYIGIIMVKNNVKEYPRYEIPDGYEFVMYQDGFEKYWAELETSVGEFDEYEKALGYFKKEFMSKKELLPDRCSFIRTTGGEFAATASVWPGDTFGKIQDKIHWVCVHPGHQGNGLAKAVLTQAMHIFNSIGKDDMTYLTTQTNSYKAINIYRKFGFRIYTGPKPASWKCQETWEEDLYKAKEIINEKIQEYQNR